MQIVVPHDSSASLGMPDIELLGIIRVMCGMIGNKTTRSLAHKPNM